MGGGGGGGDLMTEVALVYLLGKIAAWVAQSRHVATNASRKFRTRVSKVATWVEQSRIMCPAKY